MDALQSQVLLTISSLCNNPRCSHSTTLCHQTIYCGTGEKWPLESDSLLLRRSL